MEQIFEILKNRRSVRKYKANPLSETQMEKLVQAAQFAPSGVNRQTRQITVVQDPVHIEQLRAAMSQVLERPTYSFFGAPALLMLSDRADNPLGCADCSCSLENVFLLATAMGLGSCWINQLREICDQPSIRPVLDALGIPANHRVWGIAALGQPDEEPKAHDKLCPVHYVP